jgi:hypothetical protein
MSQCELELPLCPLSGLRCKGSQCAAAVALKRGKDREKVRWVCGLVRAECDEGRIVVDVTREGD